MAEFRQNPEPEREPERDIPSQGDDLTEDAQGQPNETGLSQPVPLTGNQLLEALSMAADIGGFDQFVRTLAEQQAGEARQRGDATSKDTAEPEATPATSGSAAVPSIGGILAGVHEAARDLENKMSEGAPMPDNAPSKLLENLLRTMQATPEPTEAKQERPVAERPAPPDAPEPSMDGRPLSDLYRDAIAGFATVEEFGDDVGDLESAGEEDNYVEVGNRKAPREGPPVTGDLTTEVDLEGAGVAKARDSDGAGPLAATLPRSVAPDVPRIAKNPEYKEVLPITSWTSGPDRVVDGLSRAVYDGDPAAGDTERLPSTQAAPMAIAARLFGDRASTLIADGKQPSDGRFRVGFLGSGPGTDAAMFLAELEKSYPDIYPTTTVEVSDVSETQLEAAQESPQLKEHAEKDGVEIVYALRDAQFPMYEEGAVPHLVIAAGVLSALPARVITVDDFIYDPKKRDTVIGQLDVPVQRETRWVDGAAGNQPLVQIDLEGARVMHHPVASLSRANYLNGLRSPEVQQALLPQLMGRLVSGEGGGVPNVPAPRAFEITDKNFRDGWDPDEIEALRDFLDGGEGVKRPEGLELREHYNFAPGMVGFMEGTLGHPDRPVGMMVMVVDNIRTRLTGDLREQAQDQDSVSDLTGVNHYANAVTYATVEGWRLAELARMRGTHVRYSIGPQGGLHAMLFDGDEDIPRVLRAERRLVEGLTTLGVKITKEWQGMREGAANCLNEAITLFTEDDPERLEHARAGLEQLYNAIQYPSVRRDHALMTEIANLCNMSHIYPLGELFGRRAVELASHTSVNAYRAVARAQLELGDAGAAAETLRNATEVSTRNAGVWEDLKAVYEQQIKTLRAATPDTPDLQAEQHQQMVAAQAALVDASMHYLNTARGLTSRQITTLLVELCEAQRLYAHLERDNEQPYTIVMAKLTADAIPIPGVDDDYRYRGGIDKRLQALPVNRQLARRTYELYHSAVQVAEILASVRRARPTDSTENKTRSELIRLRKGLQQAKANLDQYGGVENNSYEHRDIPVHVGGRAVAHSIAYEFGLEEDTEGAPSEVRRRLASELTLIREDEDVEVVEATIVDEEDPTEIRRQFISSLRASLGLPAEIPPDQVLETCKAAWAALPPASTDDRAARLAARQRLVIAQLLTGRELTVSHLRAMRPQLKDLLDKGGDFDVMSVQLGLFKADMDDNNV